MKRLFSSQALANFAKGLIKLAVIGSVKVALLWPQRHRLGKAEPRGPQHRRGIDVRGREDSTSYRRATEVDGLHPLGGDHDGRRGGSSVRELSSERGNTN